MRIDKSKGSFLQRLGHGLGKFARGAWHVVKKVGKTALNVAAKAGAPIGATVGGIIGSIVPGAGTAAGAATGAKIGSTLQGIANAIGG